MLKLRYPAVCAACGTALAVGTSAWWDARTREVTCAGCMGVEGRPAIAQPPAAELDPGSPGASARREYLRRRHNRETSVRRRHPLIGGLMLALNRPPGHETAFLRGAAGEESVAKSLQRLTAKGDAIILHDRAMPRSRANIDHLAIAPTGVYVIDAKNISGKVRVSRPLFGDAKLIVEGRNRRRLVDGLDRQVAAVRQALTDLGAGDVPARGVLCFTARAGFPLLGRLEVRGHRLHHVRALARKLNRSGPLDAEAIGALAESLASAFPPA
jgi:hypothetical protein